MMTDPNNTKNKEFGTINAHQTTFDSWMEKMKNKTLCCGLAIFALLCSGCAYEPVKPWHWEILSQDRAQPISDALEFAADDHIYFSKEAAHGGQSVSGGGCGCN